MIESYGSPLVVDGKQAIDRPRAIEAVRFYTELFTKQKVAPQLRAWRRLPPDHGGLQDRPDRDGLAPHRLLHRDRRRNEAGHLGHGADARRPRRAYRPRRLPVQRHRQPGRARTPPGRGSASGASRMRRSHSWRRPATSRPRPRSPPIRASRATRSTPPRSKRRSSAGCRSPSPASPGWSDNVVQPEFQKALTGRSTPAAAVDAMIAGLDAAL